MALDLKDLLLDKPVSLCYWELSSSYAPVKAFLERNTEWRKVVEIKEIFDWLKFTEVSNLVIGVNTSERASEIKDLLDQISLEKRRNLFIIYVTPFSQTLDPRESFLYGVNLVINEKDLSEFEKIFQKSKFYWESLYLPFKKSLEKLYKEAF